MTHTSRTGSIDTLKKRGIRLLPRRTTPLLILLVVGLFPGWAAAQDAMQQRLGEVNGLLQQIEGLTGQSLQITPPNQDVQQRANPFANASGLSFDPAQLAPLTANHGPAQVQVEPNQIVIELNGRKIAVPRAVTPTQGPTRSLTLGPAVGGQPALNRTAEALQLANAYTEFAAAIDGFQQGDAQQALEHLTPALPLLSDNPAVCQVAALMHFDAGNFDRAAGLAYQGLQTQTRPLSWDSIVSLYGQQSQRYAAQYQRLQQVAAENPESAAVQFLLGYHHLMLGHLDHAQRSLAAASEKLGSEDPVLGSLRQMASQKQPAPPQPNR